MHADFVKEGKEDMYLAVLKAKQTLHVDLSKLQTYHPSQDDIARSATRAATKSDIELASPKDQQNNLFTNEDELESSLRNQEDPENLGLQSPNRKANFKQRAIERYKNPLSP